MNQTMSEKFVDVFNIKGPKTMSEKFNEVIKMKKERMEWKEVFKGILGGVAYLGLMFVGGLLGMDYVVSKNYLLSRADFFMIDLAYWLLGLVATAIIVLVLIFLVKNAKEGKEDETA